MRPYISLLKLRFALLLQYRAAALAGVSTQFLFGLVRVMIFDGFYASTIALQPMTYAQTVTYIWLGQALLGLLPWNGDPEVQSTIRTGNVAYELCRPLDLYNHWFFRALAQRMAPALLRSVPLLIVAFFILPSEYRMSLPPSPAAAAAFLVSMAGAVLLAGAITNLINISMLWTISGEGAMRLVPAVVLIGSGMIVPLPFFPESVQGVLGLLPFSGLVDTPYRFYLGLHPAGDIWGHLSLQLLWASVLILLGRWVLSQGMKRVVVQGG